eukprot:g366.t1
MERENPEWKKISLSSYKNWQDMLLSPPLTALCDPPERVKALSSENESKELDPKDEEKESGKSDNAEQNKGCEFIHFALQSPSSSPFVKIDFPISNKANGVGHSSLLSQEIAAAESLQPPDANTPSFDIVIYLPDRTPMEMKVYKTYSVHDTVIMALRHHRQLGREPALLQDACYYELKFHEEDGLPMDMSLDNKGSISNFLELDEAAEFCLCLKPEEQADLRWVEWIQRECATDDGSVRIAIFPDPDLVSNFRGKQSNKRETSSGAVNLGFGCRLDGWLPPGGWEGNLSPVKSSLALKKKKRESRIPAFDLSSSENKLEQKESVASSSSLTTGNTDKVAAISISETALSKGIENVSIDSPHSTSSAVSPPFTPLKVNESANVGLPVSNSNSPALKSSIQRSKKKSRRRRGDRNRRHIITVQVNPDDTVSDLLPKLFLQKHYQQTLQMQRRLWQSSPSNRHSSQEKNMKISNVNSKRLCDDVAKAVGERGCMNPSNVAASLEFLVAGEEYEFYLRSIDQQRLSWTNNYLHDCVSLHGLVHLGIRCLFIRYKRYRDDPPIAAMRKQYKPQKWDNRLGFRNKTRRDEDFESRMAHSSRDGLSDSNATRSQSGDLSVATSEHRTTTIPFQNEVRGTRQEWWRVVKINPRGKLQTRLIGVDLIYVYNKIPIDKKTFFHDKVRNPHRPLKDIVRIEVPSGGVKSTTISSGSNIPVINSAFGSSTTPNRSNAHSHRSSAEAVYPFVLVFKHEGDSDETKVSYRAYAERDRTEILNKIEYIRKFRAVNQS